MFNTNVQIVPIFRITSVPEYKNILYSMLMTKRSLYCGSPLSRNIMYVFIQCWCRNGPFISFFGTTVPKHKNILYSLLMSKRFFYFGSALSRNVMYVCIQYWCKNGLYISVHSGCTQDSTFPGENLRAGCSRKDGLRRHTQTKTLALGKKKVVEMFPWTRRKAFALYTLSRK